MIDQSGDSGAFQCIEVYYCEAPQTENSRLLRALIRQRAFRFDGPVSKETVPDLSEINSGQPYFEWSYDIEQLLVNQRVVCPGERNWEDHERDWEVAQKIIKEVIFGSVRSAKKRIELEKPYLDAAFLFDKWNPNDALAVERFADFAIAVKLCFVGGDDEQIERIWRRRKF